jgi:hypothetical protein
MGVSPIAVPQGIARALSRAGDKSNVDFDYLLQTAMRESSLDPEARAATSSAVGLFQFLDSTWLQVMKEEGPRLGYQSYADAITTDSEGDYVIRDKGLRKRILALREDPQIAADLAAAFTKANGAYLQDRFGRQPSAGELYIAHFLGPKGAEKLFAAGLSDPDQLAARLFPKQAKANPSIFYAEGKPRTIRELYRVLVAKHAGPSNVVTVDDPKFAAQQMSGRPGERWSSEAVPSRFSRADMSFTSLVTTEPSRPAEPLVAVDMLRSIAVPEVAAPLLSAYAPSEATNAALEVFDNGYVPLPAPPPLIPAASPQVTMAGGASADTGAPRARVLMSRPPADDNAFLTQLYARP